MMKQGIFEGLVLVALLAVVYMLVGVVIPALVGVQ
jgi:hypothetical protein